MDSRSAVVGIAIPAACPPLPVAVRPCGDARACRDRGTTILVVVHYRNSSEHFRPGIAPRRDANRQLQRSCGAELSRSPRLTNNRRAGNSTWARRVLNSRKRGGVRHLARIEERSALLIFRFVYCFPWSSTMKNLLVSFALALVLTGLTCGSAPAQFYNDNYVNSTGTTATSLDLTFSGNVTSNLYSAGTFVYSFPYPGGNVIESTMPYSSPGLTVSASYNSTTNTTTLVYSGTAGVVNGATAHVGYGMTGGTNGGENTQSPAFLAASWDSSAGTLLPANPVLTETISGAGTLSTSGSQATTFVLLHADAALTLGGVATGEWAEFQVPTNAQGTPWFENDSTVPVTLSNVGYQLSPTLIPLDQLNNISEPASSFTPLGGIPDGTTLQPGQAVPEPSTLALLGAGGIGLLGYVWRRRRRSA